MIDIWHIDAIWISIAFIAGYLAKKIHLPPLIGFLATGFVLNALGYSQGNVAIHAMSELGVMLLLFSIGLKLDLKSLLKKEIWATASIQMVIVTLSFASIITLITSLGLSEFTEVSFKTALIIGFSLSFSSTVFAIKILEDRGEINSFHGKTAIGILVFQDVLAVLFLTISKSNWPSIWVLALPVYLWLIRYLFFKILKNIGHGELFTLFGFFAAFVAGAMSFDVVGLKPDLGALIMGVMLGKHGRAKELASHMSGYKDFFLIAFFFEIGLSGLPTWQMALMAVFLLLLLAIKGGLFMLLLTRFNLRARTSLLATLSLSNYSEFGLIVAVIGVQSAWMESTWLVTLALALSFSFVLTAPFNHRAHDIFNRYKTKLMKLNTHKVHLDDEPTDLGDAEYLVCGMGRIGRSVYRQVKSEYRGKVIGVDYDHDIVMKAEKLGKNVRWGDATDSIFWQNVDLSKIKMVFLAFTNHTSNVNTSIELQHIMHPETKIGAVCEYRDQAKELLRHKVDYIYNIREQVGKEFANEFIHIHDTKSTS